MFGQEYPAPHWSCLMVMTRLSIDTSAPAPSRWSIRKAVFRLMRRAAGRPARNLPLLSLVEVRHRLDLVEQRYTGTQVIPVERIIGTLDRSRDFDRRFHPRRPEQQQRLNTLRRAFPNNDFPPIVVYDIGGAYFLSDGHHRVALAHERGILELDAEVTRIQTRYEIPSDADIRQVIHTQQRQQFMERSALARARPHAVIEFSCPQGYPEALELIKAHG
jgi:hypothetical protein